MTPFHLRRRIARLLVAGTEEVYALAAEPEDPGRAFCHHIVRKSGSSFAYAFLFLPPSERAAIEAVYTLFRLADDAVDEPSHRDPFLRLDLEGWRVELRRSFDRTQGAPATLVGPHLRKVTCPFGIELEDLEVVLDGIAMDLGCFRYESWPKLETYCQHVAGAVGLACLKIFGCTSPAAHAYALDLGTALQLTNILRDVGEDARRGRIYLPLEDLERFGVSAEEIVAQYSTAAFRRLIAFEAARAHSFFDRASTHLGRAEQGKLLPAELMGDIYEALLQEIEQHPDDVLGEPPHLRRRRKIALVVRRWIETRLAA